MGKVPEGATKKKKKELMKRGSHRRKPDCITVDARHA